ncbi:hypothetical protein Acr_00g0026610 [Actinidia rufa]|uniref:Uncharacterized protein n=1 Tax=Actinidia rufa TaxID=165716 RepID=A0A7J0DDP3_9ERIC|nr:hypothetical protein Acr_00g0026610 [Actinidia rufa]
MSSIISKNKNNNEKTTQKILGKRQREPKPCVDPYLLKATSLHRNSGETSGPPTNSSSQAHQQGSCRRPGPPRLASAANPDKVSANQKRWVDDAFACSLISRLVHPGNNR